MRFARRYLSACGVIVGLFVITLDAGCDCDHDGIPDTAGDFNAPNP